MDQATVLGGAAHRNAGVALVDPQVEAADGEEPAIRLRADRCQRLSLDVGIGEPGDLGPSAIEDLVHPDDELVGRHRCRFDYQRRGLGERRQFVDARAPAA